MGSHHVIPRAAPFYFPGDRTACLLVHGFTGSPTEMRWMGEYLAGNGHTVLGVRLPGHATRPEDMNRMRARDWLAAVEDGWHLLRPLADRVFVMGLSMGGALSLLLAARFPVAGLVLMAVPHSLPADPRLRFVKPLSTIMPFVGKGPSNARNLEALDWHFCYPRYPTRAVGELNLILASMRTALPQVQSPVLLVYSRGDTSVGEENAHAIYRDLGSPDKTLLWVENSGHNIPLEPDRETVYQAAVDFVHGHLKDD